MQQFIDIFTHKKNTKTSKKKKNDNENAKAVSKWEKETMQDLLINSGYHFRIFSRYVKNEHFWFSF